MSLVNVHNEWGQLEEVIVGIARNAHVPLIDKGLYEIEYRDYYKNPFDIETGLYPAQVRDEAEEDLEILVDTLHSLRITVRRPKEVDYSKFFGTPDWKSSGNYNYCPRDSMLAIGNTIIETPMPLRARYFETFAYKDILIDYLKSESRWISAPKPCLPDDTYRTGNKYWNILANKEPLFDAANVLRVGRDLLYLISGSGNELGAKWLQSTLGSQYTVHICRDMYAGTHIDSTITFLRPGLVLLNPSRVNENNLPPILRNWDKLWAPEMVDIGYHGKKPYSSLWVGMNFLMVNEQLAIVEQKQKPLIQLLNRFGIEVIPLQLRHALTLGGGFHCVTLDIRRQGTLESYI